MSASDHLNPVQFDPDEYTGLYHGTAHELAPGAILTAAGANKAGRQEGYKRRSYVYFTGSAEEAGDYARSRAYPEPGHVYAVKPLDDFTEDYEGNQDDGYKTKGRVQVLRRIGSG